MTDLRTIRIRLSRPVDAASSGAFRILFGAMMTVSTARFLARGFVSSLYLEPTFHFAWPGFSWVKPLPAPALYAVFGVMLVASIAVMLGVAYRVAIAVFFVTFTYVELLDRSIYLNHYYLISILSGLMCFLPLDRWAALRGLFAHDRDRANERATVPAWVLYALRLQVGLVYFFAGVAKIRADWLFRGEPLHLWLSTHTDLPVVGPYMDDLWLAIAMGWGGMLFDLLVAFALLHRRTRVIAYVAVIVFHGITGFLFPIGVFPLVMTALAPILFEPDWPRRLGRWLRRGSAGASMKSMRAEDASTRDESPTTTTTTATPREASTYVLGAVPFAALALYFAIQLLLPIRHFAYPGDTGWSEEGFRFAWRVMLIEKTGHVDFLVRSKRTGEERRVSARRYLTPFQLRQMSTQPDMIVAFAHHLAELHESMGKGPAEVRAEAWVAYDGRPAALLLDPTVDLTTVDQVFGAYRIVRPLDE